MKTVRSIFDLINRRTVWTNRKHNDECKVTHFPHSDYLFNIQRKEDPYMKSYDSKLIKPHVKGITKDINENEITQQVS